MSKHSKLVLKKIRIRPKTKNNLKNEKTETESKSKDKSKTKINLKDKINPNTNTKDKDKTETRKNPKELSLFRKKSSRKVEPEILDNQQSKYNAITEESIDEVVKLMDEYREPDTQSLRDSQSLRNIASIIDSTLSEDDDDSEYDDVLYHNNSLVQSKLNKHDDPDNELSWTNGAEVVAKCVYAAANFMAIKLTSFFEEKYQVDDKYDFKSDEIEKLKQSLQVENISVLEDESVELRMENDSVVANYVYVPLVEGNQKIVIDEGDKDLVCMEIVREKDQDEIEVIMNYVGEEKPIIDEMSALVSHAEKLVICTSDVKSMSEIINENVEAFAFKFRDQMSSSVLDLLDTCTENDVMSTLIKDKDSRDFLDATGKVMLAGLAGAALLTEAIQKSVNKAIDTHRIKTARKVRKRFGTLAGKIVEDGGQAIHDALKSVYFVSRMNDGVVVNFVAKAVGRKDMNKKAIIS